MREILFRGKPLMPVTGLLKSRPEIVTDGFIFGELGIKKDNYFIGPNNLEPMCPEMLLRPHIQVIPETVGQFTGLTDKNGKKIFEGDVVRCAHYVGDDYEYAVVAWENESCGFEPFSDSKENCGHCGGGWSPYFAEVVGNVYDNPELVEKVTR